MGKNQNTLNDLSDLRSLFGLPESIPGEEKEITSNNSVKEVPGLEHSDSKIRIHLQRLKGNREATVIKGFEETDEVLEDLSTRLKKTCGVGGSAKNGEIIIQGNQRQKALDFLQAEGFKDTKFAGG